MEFINNLGAQLSFYAWSMNSRLAVIYLATTVLIAFAIWALRGRPKTFLGWLFPASVYRHHSNLLDFKILLFNTVLAVAGLFAAVGFAPIVAASVLNSLVDFSSYTYTPAAATWVRSAFATLIMILTLDFCKYWAHYFHHESRVLWPFHAVHHSAEVMTPLTVARVHPMFRVIQTMLIGLIVGAVQGVMLFALIGKIDILTIGSANVGYVVFNMLGSNLRHSHIWLSYGQFWEHIFISPAQHHIHHSNDKKHFNKNYGEVFAFWDWMFGTLYVLKGYEKLSFGIADEKGNPMEQPHPTLRAALLHPFIESWEHLRGPKQAKPQAQK